MAVVFRDTKPKKASPNETYICSIDQLATVSLGLCIFSYIPAYIYIYIPAYIYICIYIYTIGYLYLPVYTELGGAITKILIKMCMFIVRSIAMGHLGISHIGT